MCRGILDRAKSEGVAVRVMGDKLRTTGKMSEELRQLLKDNKQAVMTYILGKPPLPAQHWATWGVNLAWVQAYASVFSEEYAVAYGMGKNGMWYVAAPNSGLTAPSPLPYVEHEEMEELAIDALPFDMTVPEVQHAY